ncbi:MAG: hypothetical protein QXS85_04995 [Acidilobaceae archaeon]
MPLEVTDLSEFAEITKRAVECRIKRVKKTSVVKIKARTKRYLYTFKTTESELDNVLKQLHCKNVIDVDKTEKSKT